MFYYFVREPCPLMTDWILHGILHGILSSVLSNTRCSIPLSPGRGPGFLLVTLSSFLPLCPSRSDMFLFQMQWADDFDMPHLLASSLKLPSSFSPRQKEWACLNALYSFTDPRTCHTLYTKCSRSSYIIVYRAIRTLNYYLNCYKKSFTISYHNSNNWVKDYTDAGNNYN